MKSKARRGILGMLGIVIAGFAGLNVLAYSHARAMLRFTDGGLRTGKPEKLSLSQKARILLRGVNVPRPASDRQPVELDPECRRLSIQCPAGVRLAGWYVDRGPHTPLVILFHGYATEKTSLLQEAATFLKLGTSVLLVDFRGSGESSESGTTIGFLEADDVASVVRYARASLPHPSLVLFGQSMGAVAILRAVSKDGIRPDAVILEAVFDTMLHTVRHRFEAMGVPSFPCAELLVFWGGVQTGFNAFAHNPAAYAQAIRCPALFMHGRDDPRATVQEGRRVCAAVAGAAEFREFPSVGHESYVCRYPGEWEAAVGRFLKKVKS